MEKDNKALSKMKEKVHQKVQNVQNIHDDLGDIEIVKVKVEIEIKFRENLWIRKFIPLNPCLL